ncbi:MAG: HEAT repeat domain-containing protein [Acidobacteriaceae bacterium]
MNCENLQQNAALYLYDELADDHRHELEMHAAGCAKCRQELTELRAMKTVFSMPEQEEPSASLLAASRMRLQESLEHERQAGGWTRFLTFDVAGWMHQLKLAPALAAGLVIAGFAGGALTTYRIAAHPEATTVATLGTTNGAPQEASIAGIRGIEQDPNDPTKVNIKFDRVMRDQAQGSVNDPRIQQLLLFAAQSQRNSGTRMDSINLLTQSSLAGSADQQVREALMYALRYDKNPGVRLKALDGLRDYVATDTRVRDAVLDALMKDSNPGVRTQAINLLQTVKADSTVRQTFSELAKNDKNEYIKTEARRVLASLPELE